MYEVGFKEGAEAEEWQHKVIDELWEQEGYSYSDAEIRLINSFSQLNDDGQYEAVKRIEELTEIPRYRRQDTPQTSPAPQEGTDTTPAADGPETAPKDE